MNNVLQKIRINEKLRLSALSSLALLCIATLGFLAWTFMHSTVSFCSQDAGFASILCFGMAVFIVIPLVLLTSAILLAKIAKAWGNSRPLAVMVTALFLMPFLAGSLANYVNLISTSSAIIETLLFVVAYVLGTFASVFFANYMFVHVKNVSKRRLVLIAVFAFFVLRLAIYSPSL